MARSAKQERRRTTLHCAQVATLFSFWLAGGCKDEARACYDLSVGERLAMTVVERYDASSQFPGAGPGPNAGCPDGTDIAAGDSLTFAVQQQVIDDEVVDCKTSLLTIENAGELGWMDVTPRNEGKYPQRPLVAYFTADLAGCEALVQLVVEERRTAAGLDDPSEPGQVPHFVLLRDVVFFDGCATSCSDEFVVSIKKSPCLAGVGRPEHRRSDDQSDRIGLRGRSPMDTLREQLRACSLQGAVRGKGVGPALL